MLRNGLPNSRVVRVMACGVALLIAGGVSAFGADLFGSWDGPNGAVYNFQKTGGNANAFTVSGGWTVNGGTTALSGTYYPSRYMAQLGFGNGGQMVVQVARDGRTAQANWASGGKTGNLTLSRRGVSQAPPAQTNYPVISGTWYTSSSVYTLQHHSVAAGARVSVWGGWVQGGKQAQITQGAYNPVNRHVELLYRLWSGHTGKLDLYLSADSKTMQGTWSQGGNQGSITLSRTQPAATSTTPGTSTNNALGIAGTWQGGAGSVYTFQHAALQGTQAVRVSGGWVQSGKQAAFTGGTYYPDRRYVEVNYRVWDGTQGTFRLTVSADGRQLSGTWSQAGQTGNITLLRGNAAPAQPVYLSIAGRWNAQGATLVLRHGTVSSGNTVNVSGTWTTDRVMQVKGTYNPKTRTFTSRFADVQTLTGNMTLTVSADGRTLSGSWTARGGQRGSVSFSR